MGVKHTPRGIAEAWSPPERGRDGGAEGGARGLAGEPVTQAWMRARAHPTDPVPFYEAHVFCCVNLRPRGHRRGCCAEKGSRLLCNYMCRRAMALGLGGLRVNHAGCLNRCELGPTMVIYPEAVWYTYSSEDDIDEILRHHVIGGARVERLLLRPDQGPRH